MPPTLQPITHMSRGSHFRAQMLRGDGRARPIDPFLGVDHAWISGPTFPPHPHAGFSAVSYLFADSETCILNRDSLGTRNLIAPGGLHWTAAGRGIVHEEVPAEAGRPVHMLQIFVNLPLASQSEPPFTLSLDAASVPILAKPGALVRVPLGRFETARSPLQPPTDVALFDVSLEAGAEIDVPLAAGFAGFLVPISGALTADGTPLAAGDEAIPAFAPSPHSRTLRLISENRRPAHVVVFSGAPLDQPVHWQGSMAMADPLALANAVRAYQAGVFGHL